MATVRSWLTAIGLDAYAEAFERHDIRLHDLDKLTDQDLKELGLTIGHRKEFQRGRAQQAAAAPAGRRDDETRSAERRHVTVVFCDIVNSVGLSERIEAEDLLDALRRYTDLCRNAIAGYHGFVARILGDAVLAYFGYPVAHENDAERAIRSSLDIIRSLDKVEQLRNLGIRVRIGIASGQVIVGDLFNVGAAREMAVLGTIPNLAARLQSIAKENAIVVAPDTWRLVRSKFEFSNMGSHRLKGLEQPIQVRKVVGEVASASPGHALRSPSTITPLVDREAERRQMGDLWQQVRGGKGQALIISGEAGIGKSRLIADFVGTIDPPPVVRHYFCSPFLNATPLGPIVSFLSNQAAIEPDDSPNERLRKLDSLVTGTGRARRDATTTAAWLLAVPHEQLAELPKSPRRQREKALEVLTQQFLDSADGDPVVNVIEDLHWSDPTTLDLIGRMVERVHDRRILLILTSRDEFRHDWPERPGMTRLELHRLPDLYSMELMRLVAGKDLVLAVVREIVRRTDGIPLFIEEFTQSVIETHDAATLTEGSSEALHIPATLHESLVSRLDRAGPAKELAQVAAVIGRSVSRELLGIVSNLAAADIDAACAFLVDAGIFIVDTSEDGEPQYAFKHALVQESAYSSLLRDRRRELHASTAAGLSRLSPDLVERRPELLAHHLTEAGRGKDALAYWLQAGRRQLSLSATVEATIHLRQGLAVLDSLPRTPEHLALRLQFLVLLAPALISVKGPGTAEVERLYAEAVEISQSIPESPEHFPVYWGWWRVSRDFRIMQQRADDLLVRARAREDDALLLQAHHCQWASHFNAGHFASSLQHVDDGMRMYEAGDYRAHASLYGNHDAKVCGHGEKALIHWLCGRPDEALDEERISLGWAEKLGHPGSRSHAMDIALTHGVYRRDAKRVLSLAKEFIDFAIDQGFSDPEAKGLIFRGWANSLLGDPAGGVREIQEGMARQASIGTTEDFPIYSCMLAESLMLAGRIPEAVDSVMRGRHAAERTGLQIWLPELWRWEGALGRIVGRDLNTAEANLVIALDTARRQAAASLQLRAATDLAALRRDRGDLAGALAVLDPALVAISGGRDTEDVRRADDLRRALHDAGG